MVHQHFMLIPVMTVAENIVLGDRAAATTGVLLDREAARERVRELASAFGFAIDPDAQGRRTSPSASSSASRS